MAVATFWGGPLHGQTRHLDPGTRFVEHVARRGFVAEVAYCGSKTPPPASDDPTETQVVYRVEHGDAWEVVA